VLAALKKHWKELSREEPGERFQNRHQRNHRKGRSSHRALKLGAGIVLLVAGLILLLIPGPGSVLILVGGALLAEESLVVARTLDRLEVQVRKLADWAIDHWKKAPAPVKALLILLALALAAGAAWLAYSYFLA
jgi:hypothetical protein